MKLFSRKNKTVLSSEEKTERTRHRLLLVLSGLMLGLSFPPFPFPFQLLMFFGLVPYFFVIDRRKSLGDINRATYLMGFVFTVITLYWVGSWQKEADPFLMISGVLLMFVNPVFFLIPSTLLYFSKKVFPSKDTLFLFPFFWITYEYLYMITQASFPWLTLGNGLADFTVFIQAADIVGAVGLSLIVIYINIFLYKGFKNYKQNRRLFYKNVIVAASIFIIVLVYGEYRLSTFNLTGNKVKVGLIQPNLDPWEKWQAGLDKLTSEYFELSRKAADKGAKLIVWPETALPVYLMNGQHAETVGAIRNFIKKNNVYLLTGMPDFHYYGSNEKHPPDAKYSESGDFYYTTYNAALFFSPNSYKVERYGKMKLVPFGEKVPYADELPFLGKLIKWGVGISGWNIGRDTTVFKIPLNNVDDHPSVRTSNDTLKINALVCFESVFPYFVSQFVKKGAQIIIVITNDSWYGNSSGPYQHKEISVLRAVENRRSVLHAANGGISTFIDPLGHTVMQSKMFTKTFLVPDANIENVETFFTKYSLILPTIASLLSLWFAGIILLRKIKNLLYKKDRAKNGRLD